MRDVRIRVALKAVSNINPFHEQNYLLSVTVGQRGRIRCNIERLPQKHFRCIARLPWPIKVTKARFQGAPSDSEESFRTVPTCGIVKQLKNFIILTIRPNKSLCYIIHSKTKLIFQYKRNWKRMDSNALIATKPFLVILIWNGMKLCILTTSHSIVNFVKKNFDENMTGIDM